MSKAAKRERQKANREAKLAQQAKEAKRQRAIKFAWRAAVVLGIVVIAGIVITTLSDSSDEPAPTTAPPDAATTVPETTEAANGDDGQPVGAYQRFREKPTACGAEQPAPAVAMEFAAPEDQAITADDRPRATLRTSCGDIVIELDPTIAPESVNSFAFLARQGFWDGTVSHRIVPDFVVQFGDPTATGTGGPGYTIVDEFPEQGFTYGRGVVAMAKTGAPDTTGSQFFIAFADTGLFAGFNPIGMVVEGLDVLDRIEAVPVQGETPDESVYLDEVLVEGP